MSWTNPYGVLREPFSKLLLSDFHSEGDVSFTERKEGRSYFRRPCWNIDSLINEDKKDAVLEEGHRTWAYQAILLRIIKLRPHDCLEWFEYLSKNKFLIDEPEYNYGYWKDKPKPYPELCLSIFSLECSDDTKHRLMCHLKAMGLTLSRISHYARAYQGENFFAYIVFIIEELTIDPLYDILPYLYCCDADEVFAAIKRLVEQQSCKVESYVVREAFYYAPFVIWLYLLSHCPKIGFQEFWYIDPMHIPDIKKLECLEEVKLPHESTIETMIQQRRSELIQWCFDKGAKVSNFENLWNCALDAGNLATLRILYKQKHASDERFASDLLSECEERINHFFMNSSLCDVASICSNLSERGFDKWGSLIARHVLPRAKQSMLALYAHSQNQSFTEYQVRFGKVFNEEIEKTLCDRTMTAHELFTRWSQARAEYAKQQNDDAWQTYAQVRNEDIERRYHDYTTKFSLKEFGHYSFALPIIRQTLATSREKKFFNGVCVCPLFYTNGAGNRFRVTTILYNLKERGEIGWKHTSVEVVHALYPEFEQFHAKAVQYQFKQDDPDDLNNFYQIVATTFWLGAHLIYRYRANAHCCLMMLARIFRYHPELPALIPRLGLPMPDCIAISQKLEDFQPSFLSYFETY